MKFIFDTNVLISGFLTTTGPSQFVLNQAFKHHEIIISEYILEEFRVKMRGKLRIPSEQVRGAIDFFKRRSTVLDIPPGEIEENLTKDKKDAPILALVKKSNPHYFITGDKELLTLKKIQTTLVLNPREAMQVL